MKEKWLFVLSLSFCLFSCSKDEASRSTITAEADVLVLNNGNWGSNDASVTLYDTVSETSEQNAFLHANGVQLGDLGQDSIIYGDDVYFAVNGSRIIFVTDMSLKIKASITVDGEGGLKLSPRRFAVGGGKIYVTYYEGFLGEIDPSDYSVKTIRVGANPDGVAYASGKLYVADSGGLQPDYCNTVSVVEAAGFKVESEITVNVNPVTVEADDDGNCVYVFSLGNYADRGPLLQMIDTRSSAVTDLEYPGVAGIARGKGNVLYVVTGESDSSWHTTGTIWKHDAAGNVGLGKFSEVAVPLFYSISADQESGCVAAGSSDYLTNGDVYLFGEDGVPVSKFDSGGLNPQKVLFRCRKE